jgi:Tfp pilus assembly protein FimT
MKKNGFTITELLISISVIIILTSVSFWGYNKRQQELGLHKEINNLIAKAEEVKERAISSQYFHRDLPEGGYGIYFTSSDLNHYILFADCDGDGEYDSSGTPCLDPVDSAQYPEMIERVAIENGIYIKDFGSSQIHITFRPPSPDVTIKIAGGSTVQNTNITLAIRSEPTKAKTIYFNTAGLIYVQ